MKLALCVLMALISASASAQTMKRCLVDGKTVYTDQACAPGDQVKEVRITDNTVDMSAERRIAERVEQERRATPLAPTTILLRPEIDPAECDYALLKYKRLIEGREKAVGKQRFTRLDQTAEAAAVRAKCGEDALPPNQARPAAPGKTVPKNPADAVYTQVAGGFVSSTGEFCPKVAGGMACPSGFVPDALIRP